ncbi:hypothetical protein TcWFU_004600 [Taenia crassiceps]|uniref:Uncharacterized protein n=1 Tax=Taenia crassiceps TaxID=6207 RepID=A0ABR4Q3V4_9CEST
MDKSQSAKIVETNLLSMLMLTNLTQSDAGNYSCRSIRKSGPISQWIYIHVKDQNGDLNGSRIVADEPHSRCQGPNCKQHCADQSNCKPKKADITVNPPAVREDHHFLEMVGKGLPIIEATKPYAFHLDSVNGFQSSDDYLNTVNFSDTCDNSLEGCMDRLGNSTALIGIGTLCSLFFIAVIVSAFFIRTLIPDSKIRRKILRQQRRVFRLQQRDQKIASPVTTPLEPTLPETALSPPSPPPPPPPLPSDRGKLPIEVIYIEKTSALGDVVYIPQSTVFKQRCSCGEISSDPPMLVPLMGSNRLPEVISTTETHQLLNSH